MEKIIDLLKVLLGKHLYPAISSIAMAILFVALKPNLFGMEKQVGKTLYGVLVFCIFFLIIEFSKYIYKSCKARQANQKEYQQEQELNKQKQERQRKLQEENELCALERMWDFVDTFDNEEKESLLQFIKSGNKPIEIKGFICPAYFSDSRLVVHTTKNATKNNPRTAKTITIYKLRDDFYQTLKLSYEKYHRISHFDLEEH